MKTQIKSLLCFLATLAALFSSAHASETFRLDRMGIVRFTSAETGKLLRRQGVLFVDGSVQWRGSFEVDRPAGTSESVLDRNLITTTAWVNYYVLGSGATWNFTLTEGAVTVTVGAESFHFIAPNEDKTAAMGKVTNISTRTRLSAANDAVIAGFVIDERVRKVLIRGVGPSLAKFGVNDPAANPLISVKKEGQTVAANANWHQNPRAADIRETAARVGAFPLDENSPDAAVLVELVPGAYTVHLESATAGVANGSVLIEVYSVPEV